MAKQVCDLGAMIEQGKTGKRELREIHSELKRLVEQLPGNTAYVQEQFQRATERTVDDARTEVEAHFDNVARRLGYQAIKDGAPVMLSGGGQQEIAADSAKHERAGKANSAEVVSDEGS
jgi:hypothetical protein